MKTEARPSAELRERAGAPWKSRHQTNYFWGTIIHPSGTFERLAADPRQAQIGAVYVLGMGIAYTLVVAGLVILHVPAMTAPWLAIPQESYYAYEVFFTLPVYLAGWALAAGVFQLLGRAMGGRGTFEASAGVLGLAITIPTLLMWIVEAPPTAACLAGLITTAQWFAFTSQPGEFWNLYIYVALVWYVALFVVAARRVQQLSWVRSIASGLVSCAVMLLFQFTLIR